MCVWMVVLFVGTACSGEGDASPVSRAESSVAVATSTTVRPTTTAASTTTVSTVPPTEPSTTVALIPEEAVRAAVAASQQAFSDCLLALPNCDPAGLAATSAGSILENNTERVTEWNSRGYAVRDRDQFRFVIESVEVAPDGMSATALVCIADGSKLVIPGAAPDDGDVIVDDAYLSVRNMWELRLDADGNWRAYDAPATGGTFSEDICPPA
jgi:hypothetical protein